MDMMKAAREAREITDSVIVGLSGGKDSVAALDVCFKTFAHVRPYFMYLVQGLEFQERALRYYEKRYGVEVLRVPHFMLSEFYRWGSFRLPDPSVKIVKPAEMDAYLRQETGLYWIAGGERMADSIVRHAMIKKSGAIDEKRGHIYPLADWNKAQVLAYNRLNRLPLSLENQRLGFSFRGLGGRDIAKIKAAFPSDYEKIKESFPLIEAEVKKYEWYGKGDNRGGPDADD